MATDAQVDKAQTVVPHVFCNREYLRQALTAPKARNEEDEECRELSPLGESLAKFFVYLYHFECGTPRSVANEAVNSVASPKYIANRAKALDIDDCVKYNPRQQGEKSQLTLRYVFNAIVGASWLDSGKDFTVCQKVAERLFIHDTVQPFIDPRNCLSSTSGMSTQLPFISSLILANYTHSSLASPDRSMTLPYDDSRITLPYFRSLTPIGEGTTNLSDASIGAIPRTWDPSAIMPVNLDIDALNPLNDLGQAESSMTQLPLTTSQHTVTGHPKTTSVPRRTLAATKQSKKRNHSPDSLSSSGVKGSQSKQHIPLEQHILLEKERCQKEELACPLRPFDQMVRQMCRNNDKLEDKKIHELKRLFFGVASSRSLVILQSIVQTYRRSFTAPYAVAGGNLSPKERLVQIQRLTGNMAYSALLRRCHVHELVIDKSAPFDRPTDGFIVSTMQTVESLVPRKPGNPGRIDDAGISRAMMSDLYPDLSSDSSEYKHKYNVVSKLRRLGQRLDLLTTKFGHGILGLLPLAADVLADSVLDIDDELILSIPDTDFKNFLQHLDQNLGSLLRRMSALVDEVIVKIFTQTLDHSTRFAIERLDPYQIIEHPRGSPELLRLISLDEIHEA